MTGIELATQFRNLVDDDFDTTHLYQLLSQAKNLIERTEKLEILKTLDSSKTAAIGDSYNTTKALPTDFRVPIKLFLNTQEYKPVKFEDQILFRNVGRKYFINQRGKTFAPTGPVSTAGTWYLFYIPKTTDFTVANEDTDNVCEWPSEFQPLLPYAAAKIYQANIDGDSISFVMSGEQEREYLRLLGALRDWDHDLKLSAMDGRTGFDPSEAEDPDVSLGDM